MTEEEFNTIKCGDVLNVHTLIPKFIVKCVWKTGTKVDKIEIVSADMFFMFIDSKICNTVSFTNGFPKGFPKSLETKIKEKELELETLKKELKEINRNKMFENLDPNTIYKIIHEDFDIGFVREWNDDSYRIFDITTRLIITIPKDRITEIIPLNEATETYKKLKNLLEKA